MIQAKNKLSQEELSEAKKLINCCQNYDGTYRDPYLSNMLGTVIVLATVNKFFRLR